MGSGGIAELEAGGLGAVVEWLPLRGSAEIGLPERPTDPAAVAMTGRIEAGECVRSLPKPGFRVFRSA